MNARMKRMPHASGGDYAIVLIGMGQVGSALMGLLDALRPAQLRLVGVANSRVQWMTSRARPELGLGTFPSELSSSRDDATLLAALDASGATHRVLVDASASEAVARRHAHWLARGYHVVTANKCLLGGTLRDWRDVEAAREEGCRYGDAATVGAGLPVLSSLRRLRACGDRLLGIEGVFSGTLSWLFNQYDGSRAFSALLRDAHALGFTEPDPRIDLSGEDVVRKLLILARTSGNPLDRCDVEVDDLVPEGLRNLPTDDFLASAVAMDEVIAARHARAHSKGCVLRHLARIDDNGRARVGLVEVPAEHPAARLQGSDNLFVLHTERYGDRPFVIQGAGAGPELTAQALLADVMAIA